MLALEKAKSPETKTVDYKVLKFDKLFKLRVEMKALICITTARRSLAVKAFVWDYIAFCKKNSDYSFIVSLDGPDQETITFCQKYKIPLLFSEQQEGVGLSKNRVLTAYSDYDHYFFIEDDVGLLNENVFLKHIEVAKELGLQHLSLFPEERIADVLNKIELNDGSEVVCSKYGGAPFNYFTREGLEKVGGFHTDFAKYRRFGHTEHTYRFVNAGLAEYPFYVIENCLYGWLEWNDPISVTKVKVDTINRIFVEECKLMDKKLSFFPVTTISAYKKPESLDLTETKRPLSAYFDKLLFKGNMLALSVYRLLKRWVTACVK